MWKSVFDEALYNLNSGSVGSARLSSEAISASPKLDVATHFPSFGCVMGHPHKLNKAMDFV